MSKTIEQVLLADLKQHYAGLIKEDHVTPVSEAKMWLFLIANSGSLVRARFYGFTYLRSAQDRKRAEAILIRYIKIFGTPATTKQA